MGRRVIDERVSLTFEHPDGSRHWAGVQAVAICPNSRALYTGSRDTRIKCWNFTRPNAATCSATLVGHTEWVSALLPLASSGGSSRLLLSASYDTTVRLWSATESRLMHTFAKPHTDYVLRLADAPRADRFVSAGLRGHLHIWDVAKCIQIAEITPNTDSFLGRGMAEDPCILGGKVTTGSVYALHCTPDGNVLAFNATDGGIQLYDTRIPDVPMMTLRGHRDNVRDVRISEDAQRLVSGSSDRTLRAWDLRAAGPTRCVNALEMHSDSVWALDSDASLARVVSGGRDGKVFLTNVKDMSTHLLSDNKAPVLSVALDSEANHVWASTTSSTVNAWPIPSRPPRAPVASLDLSEERALLADGSASEANFSVSPALPLPSSLPQYDVECEAPVLAIPGAPALVKHAVFENRRHILTLDDAGSVGLWDIVFCKHVQTFPKGTDFDHLFEKLFFKFLAAVTPWFTSDINQGVLTLHLQPASPSAFAAELYIAHLYPEQPDDQKWNYGHQLLTAMFEALKQRALGRPNVEAHVRKPGPFSFYLDPDVAAAVTCTHSPSGQRWRKSWRNLAASDLHAGMLPAWATDAVMKAFSLPSNQRTKASFTILPAAGSALPQMPQVRLTAPVILEIRKVAAYVEAHLTEARVACRTFEVPYDMSEATESARRTAHEAPVHGTGGTQPPLIAIMHEGRLLPSALSLNTVKRYLCSGMAADDIPLQYDVVDWRQLPLLAEVHPKKAT